MSTTQEGTNSAGSTIGTPVEVRPRGPWKGLALTFAVLAALFLITTLWGWLARPEGNYNIKLVVGLITLFGTLLTVAVSVIGLMLKDNNALLALVCK